MASLYKKVINGKPYWYLREMAWVAGKPKMVSERYLGSGAEVGALLDAREVAVMPERTRHLGFGDVAAVWGMLTRLGIIETIDEVVGARRSDAGASVGTYLALAVLNRLVAPCSKLAFAQWWRTTAADRFTRIPAAALDHRKFWEAMHAVTAPELAAIEHRLALRRFVMPRAVRCRRLPRALLRECSASTYLGRSAISSTWQRPTAPRGSPPGGRGDGAHHLRDLPPGEGQHRPREGTRARGLVRGVPPRHGPLPNDGDLLIPGYGR